jgi:hypothetical protein
MAESAGDPEFVPPAPPSSPSSGLFSTSVRVLFARNGVVLTRACMCAAGKNVAQSNQKSNRTAGHAADDGVRRMDVHSDGGGGGGGGGGGSGDADDGNEVVGEADPLQKWWDALNLAGGRFELLEVPQLQAYCRLQRLPTRGAKRTLIKRIRDSLNAPA